MFEFSFEAFGTSLSISVLDTLAPIMQEKIKTEILDFTYWFDETFSRFKQDSLITNMSRIEGIYEVPRMLVEMLKIYKQFEHITHGAMNPLIGNAISDLGYDANYTLRRKPFIRPTPKFNDALKIISESKIELKEKVLIDIGALGKGFWVDEIGKILDKNKITNFIVNGSGDILYRATTKNPLTISLEDPDNSGKFLGQTKIINGAICGSGIGKRNWTMQDNENLHHVINANNGTPTEGIASVWIIAKTATIADALATAAFFVDPEILLENFEFEYYIYYTNKKALYSRDFFAIHYLEA